MSKKKTFKKNFFRGRNFFVPPKQKSFEFAEGVLKINSRGFGFVICEEGSADIFVERENLGGALSGDKVKVRLLKKFGGKNREGEVTEILTHATEIFVGTVKTRKQKFFFAPDNADLQIKLSPGADEVEYYKTLRRMKVKVAVKVLSWEKLTGEVVEVLGAKSDKGVDISEIILSHGVIEEFPADVQAEAERVETEPSVAEISRRVDRRDLKIVTIDGEDAKDLDDGVFAEKIDGGYFLGVYIADVSFYVTPKSFLDREAARRSTSIYPVDRVVPMLPRELSNGICSLNAGVNRLAFACEMNLDFSGRVTSYKIFPTVIKVFRRLSYTQTNKFFGGETQELADCAENLNTLLEIYKLRKKIRTERGAIDFDLPELKIKLDAEGKPVELTKKISGVAESLIEECMLAANETVAEHTLKKKIPSVYRVHEVPAEEKVATLNQLLAHFNLHIAKTKTPRPKDFQEILAKVKNSPAEKVISTFALRTMQQARYSSENLGHFGLAAEFYTHFTSPIRRYPDLIVHRMLRLSQENFSEVGKFARRLDEIAKKSSELERRAVDIERESSDLKSVEYMAQFVGRKFDAVISSVTNFGFFVELENGVEGLVRATTLRDDFYKYVESEFALIGSQKGKSFHVGDEVRVKLAEANVQLRQLSFELVAGVAAKNLLAAV